MTDGYRCQMDTDLLNLEDVICPDTKCHPKVIQSNKKRKEGLLNSPLPPKSKNNKMCKIV